MDYKTLLEKYMKHVQDCEGINFLPVEWYYMSEVEFTQEEKDALQAINDKVGY